MLHRSCRFLFSVASMKSRRIPSPLEVLTQIQLGISAPLSMQRVFLLEHFELQLEQRGITEAKLLAMDGRLCTSLMKQIVYSEYLSVPFRVFGFDMEFTGPPVFTADGPTEDITEMGLYSPGRDCIFSCLVRPDSGRRQKPEVAELTQITNASLEAAPSFPEAWGRFLDFIHTPEPGELLGAEAHILLLSHGGKLADVSLIKWTLDKFRLPLPPSFVFGDTVHLIRDAHRHRPVTVDKYPHSWRLMDLIQWMKMEPTLPAHRAGNDAKMTWHALYHTLLRYGDDEMTPRDQLVPRFFDKEAKAQMADRFRHNSADSSSRCGVEGDKHGEVCALNDIPGLYLHAGSLASSTASSAESLLDVNFDDIFSSATTTAAGTKPSSTTHAVSSISASLSVPSDGPSLPITHHEGEMDGNDPFTELNALSESTRSMVSVSDGDVGRVGRKKRQGSYSSDESKLPRTGSPPATTPSSSGVCRSNTRAKSSPRCARRTVKERGDEDQSMVVV